MKTLRPLTRSLLGPIFVAALTATAAASTISGDPGHSSAQFSVKHLAITTVTGTIPVLAWSATTTPALIPDSIVATLDAKSIDTRNSDRDKDLRGNAWLNVDKYPTITFKSMKIVPGPNNTFKATGDLTINGITKPATLDGEFEGSVVDGYGNKRAGYTATTTVDRRDFGLNFGVTTPGGSLVVGNNVTLTIQAEGIIKS
jgi:polyisoprenoid-binding protein YceI